MTERNDLLMVLIWLVGLQDEDPKDAKEQWSLAWAAARAAIKAELAGSPANDHNN